MLLTLMILAAEPMDLEAAVNSRDVTLIAKGAGADAIELELTSTKALTLGVRAGTMFSEEGVTSTKDHPRQQLLVLEPKTTTLTANVAQSVRVVVGTVHRFTRGAPTASDRFVLSPPPKDLRDVVRCLANRAAPMRDRHAAVWLKTHLNERAQTDVAKRMVAPHLVAECERQTKADTRACTAAVDAGLEGAEASKLITLDQLLAICAASG